MPKFGDLESAVMDLLWSAACPLTVREVKQAFADERPLAYTTFQTVLDRLAGKGLLVRTEQGKANGYLPTRTRADHTAAVMQEALHAAGDPSGALLRFVERIDHEQHQALAAALELRTHPRID